MAQEQQNSTQLPDEGEGWVDKQQGQDATPITDAEHRTNVVTLLEAKGLNSTRFVEMKFFGRSATIKPPSKPLSEIWGGAPNSNHETEFTVAKWTTGLNAGFINSALGNQHGDSPISSLGAASSNAVQRAQEKLKRAKQELQEALDVERAMLHLAQLQTVQRAHKELYGPDPETGMTAAQEYSAFKQAQREQQSK